MPQKSLKQVRQKHTHTTKQQDAKPLNAGGKKSLWFSNASLDNPLKQGRLSELATSS